MGHESSRDVVDVNGSASASSDRPMTDAPTVDVVVPVYNEEAALAASVERLHHYLATQFPFTWRITIADNASTDATAAIGAELAERLRRRALRPPRPQGSGPGAAHRLDQQRRGRAGLHRRRSVHRARRAAAAGGPAGVGPLGPGHRQSAGRRGQRGPRSAA